MNEPLITVVGNLTADPEVKYTQAGLAVVNFTIASTPRVKDGDQWKDGEALFLRASAWRDLAENIGQALHKGSRVVAQGRLTSRSYETKEGEKRTSLELQIEDIGVGIPRTKPNAQRGGPTQVAGSPTTPPFVAPQQDFPTGEYDPNAPF